MENIFDIFDILILNYRVVEKDMCMYSIHETGMFSSNTDKVVN